MFCCLYAIRRNWYYRTGTTELVLQNWYYRTIKTRLILVFIHISILLLIISNQRQSMPVSHLVQTLAIVSTLNLEMQNCIQLMTISNFQKHQPWVESSMQPSECHLVIPALLRAATFPVVFP